MIRSLALCLMVAAAAPSDAGSCRSHKVQPIVASTGFTVTAFAVPVGVPVAPLSSVYYSYGSAQPVVQAAPATTPKPCACGSEHCGAPPTMAEPGGPEPITPQAAVHPGAAILRSKCAACHTGETAKGGFKLFDAAAVVSGASPWADGWRDHKKAIFDQLRSDKMPKGGPALTPEQFTDVVDFLLSE